MGCTCEPCNLAEQRESRWHDMDLPHAFAVLEEGCMGGMDVQGTT